MTFRELITRWPARQTFSFSQTGSFHYYSVRQKHMTLEPGRSGEHMETAGLGPQGPRSEKPLPHSEEFGPDDPRISRPASAAQLGMWILRQFQTERYSTAVYKAAMIDGDLNYLAL